MTFLRSKLIVLLIPLCALLGALVIGAIMLGTIGADPIKGYWTMISAD